jgi:hypothetical protein
LFSLQSFVCRTFSSDILQPEKQAKKKFAGKFSSLWREKIMKNCTIENTTEHTTCNKSVVGINFTKSVVYASGPDGTRFDIEASNHESN